MDLEIFIITYNRSSYLKKTLEILSESILCNLQITVLNNCSKDNTVDVCDTFKNVFPNFKIVTHRINIGAGANVLRAFEFSRSKYTWILCDDDHMDFSNLDDLQRIVKEGDVDLIHVGAHRVSSWHLGGNYYTASELMELGYPYFKFASFLPCNIFRTEAFLNGFVIKGYNNVVNAYPHMPFLLHVYEANRPLYLLRTQIIVAREEGQGYNYNQWFKWWMNTCLLMSQKSNVKLAFSNAWETKRDWLNALLLFKRDNPHLIELDLFIKNYLSKEENYLLTKMQLCKKLQSIRERLQLRTRIKKIFLK